MFSFVKLPFLADNKAKGRADSTENLLRRRIFLFYAWLCRKNKWKDERLCKAKRLFNEVMQRNRGKSTFYCKSCWRENSMTVKSVLPIEEITFYISHHLYDNNKLLMGFIWVMLLRSTLNSVVILGVFFLIINFCIKLFAKAMFYGFIVTRILHSLKCGVNFLKF